MNIRVIQEAVAAARAGLIPVPPEPEPEPAAGTHAHVFSRRWWCDDCEVGWYGLPSTRCWMCDGRGGDPGRKAHFVNPQTFPGGEMWLPPAAVPKEQWEQWRGEPADPESLVRELYQAAR